MSNEIVADTEVSQTVIKFKPYPSWVWCEETQNWVTPNGKKAPLVDGVAFTWSEESQDWVALN